MSIIRTGRCQPGSAGTHSNFPSGSTRGRRCSRWLWNSPWCGRCFCRAVSASLGFFIVTGLQIGMILTANYAFLNYLVLSLGFLLLDDHFLRNSCPRYGAGMFAKICCATRARARQGELIKLDLHTSRPPRQPHRRKRIHRSSDPETTADAAWISALAGRRFDGGPLARGICLAWLLYANIFQILGQLFRSVTAPCAAGSRA